VVRAVLEGIAARCCELLEVLRADAAPAEIDVLRVDGGAARCDFLLQCQADLAGIPLERAEVLDAASLGAAYLAGLATGFWHDTAELAAVWRRDRVFEPRVGADERAERLARWHRLVEHARATP
jgi:glycerol kinase